MASCLMSLVMAVDGCCLRQKASLPSYLLVIPMSVLLAACCMLVGSGRFSDLLYVVKVFRTDCSYAATHKVQLVFSLGVVSLIIQ
jgi:hypothetical protein